MPWRLLGAAPCFTPCHIKLCIGTTSSVVICSHASMVATCWAIACATADATHHTTSCSTLQHRITYVITINLQTVTACSFPESPGRHIECFGINELPQARSKCIDWKADHVLVAALDAFHKLHCWTLQINFKCHWNYMIFMHELITCLIMGKECALGTDHEEIPEYHKHRLFRSTPLSTSVSIVFTSRDVLSHRLAGPIHYKSD